MPARIRQRLSESPALLSALLASVLVFATFPDVFVAGTSLRITDQLWGSYQNLELVRVHPPVSATEGPLAASKADWLVSYNDIGGAVWQSEPAMEFMRHSLGTLDSPYWNPYSSAGALGPETLVDLKFSAFTIAYAALGGGTLLYDILLLAFFWAGTYFLIRLAREKLQLSVQGCAAAGVFYLLNGYSAGNIGSNVAMSYPLIPLCLYGSFSFVEKGSWRRFSLTALAFAGLLSFTFLPTTIVTVVAIVGCTVGYALAREGRRSEAARTAAITVLAQSGTLVAAVGVLAVIYLPFAESLQTTGLLGLYTQRTFYPALWTGALSLFTPSHFFNSSWLQMEPEAAKLSGNTIYHFGVLGLATAACAWRTPSSRRNVLVFGWAVVLALILGRIFAVPLVNDLVGFVPVLRNLGDQYLWVGLAIPLTLLVGLGVDNILGGTAARLPAIFVLAVAVAAGATLGVAYGLRGPDASAKTIALGTALFFWLIAAIVILTARRGSPAQRSVITTAFVVALFVELAVDARWLRFEANDSFAHPTSEVSFLQSHIGGYRTMTLGAFATTMDRGAAYQLQEVTSLNMGTLPGYQGYFDQMTRALPQQYRIGDFVSLAYPQDAADLGYYDWSSIDLLGVKYIIVPKTSVEYLLAFPRNGFQPVHDSQFTVVFENPNVLPRAFAVGLDGPPAGDQVTLPADLKSRIGPATIAAYRNTDLEITGTADRPVLIVLTDNWHPNWRAVVNGLPAPILKVNGTFRGVWVPSGGFDIRMSYEPGTLPIAMVTSALATLVLLALAFGRRPPLRRAQTHGDASIDVPNLLTRPRS